MLIARTFFLFAVPIILASFIDEEGDAEDDDYSFFQLSVEPVSVQRRSKPVSHTPDVPEMVASVTADGDVDVDMVAEVSLLQTSIQLFQRRQDVGGSSELAVTDIDMPTVDSPAAKGGASRADGWLDHALESLAFEHWRLRECLCFALCLVVLQVVVWRAAQTRSSKTKGFDACSWASPAPSGAPQRPSLTLPLRELFNSHAGSVKLSRFADGLDLWATLVQDEKGERTVHLTDAADLTDVHLTEACFAETKQALMSVGPVPATTGLQESGADVHRYSTGCTLGALRADGPGSWSLSKDGQTVLSISSSAPFTLAMSMSDREVAWVKPASNNAKETDSVDISFCEGTDPVLCVSCALAVLVTLSSSFEDSPLGPDREPVASVDSEDHAACEDQPEQ